MTEVFMDDLGKRKSDRIEHIGAGPAAIRHLVDLSTSGACCIGDKQKIKGAIIHVEINAVRLSARVVYCAAYDKKFRLGVQFADLVSQQKLQLEKLVDGYSKGVPVDCRIIDE
jgi:hypothetical protein